MIKFKPAQLSPGFTLIELLLVMGIIGVLFSITSILLLGLIPKASLISGSEVLIADLRQQQAKAMVGESEGSGNIQSYGVKIEAQQYVLFVGQTYDPNQAGNFIVAVPEPLNLSTSFANQEVIFSKGSGELLNFVPTSNTITITNTQGGQTTELEFNRYGIINAIN